MCAYHGGDARKLKLFDETTKLGPPDLARPSDSRKLTALQDLHATACARDATLRGMLFDLKSLDVVRVIEDVDGQSGRERGISGEEVEDEEWISHH